MTEITAIEHGVLSVQEEGVWLANQLTATAQYNTWKVVEFRGVVDEHRLRDCLRHLSARHHALRFQYTVHDGVPVRQVLPEVEVPLVVEGVESVAAGVSRAGVLAGAAFDVGRGPLWRAGLFECAGGGVLVLVFHHVVLDGWSVEVLLRELRSLYLGEGLGADGVRYADFAMWQRDRLSGERGDRLRGFWRDALTGVSEVDLPVDFPRPVVLSGRGGVVRFSVSAEVAARVASVAREERTTVFAVLLAGFHVLLGRLCRCWETPVGVPVANRVGADLESVVGLFVNSVVLRVGSGPEVSFRELVRGCRDMAMDALEHQELPFSWVVRDVAPVRDPGRNPLFQVMFAVDDTAADSVVSTGETLTPWGDDLHVRAVPLDVDTAKFDLDLTVHFEPDGGLGCDLVYSTDLFAEGTVRAYADALASLWDRLTANPDVRLGDVALADPIASVEPAPVGVADLVPSLIWAQARQSPDAVAVVAGDETLTFAELTARAETLAGHLYRQGVRPGDIVAVHLPRGTDFITSALAVMHLGAAYLPVDPEQPEVARRRVLDAAKPVAVLDAATVAGVAADRMAAPAHHPEQGAYVIFTSGSTGQPKGVLVSQATMARFVRDRIGRYAIGPLDRTMFVHSVAFDVHVEEIYPALSAGAGVVIEPFEHLAHPEVLVRTAVDRRVTILELPTALFHLLAEQWPKGLRLPDSVRVVIVGGERLDEPLAREWQRRAGALDRLYNSYGLTEATSESTVAQVRPGGPGKGSGVGTPLRHVRCEVVDHLLHPLPAMIPGELVIAGPCLAHGYLDDSARTAESFVPDASGGAGRRAYRTGDRARRNELGNLELLGRRDRQIKRNGFRLDLGEVEAVLRLAPHVGDVVAAWHAERLRLFVVPGSDTPAEAAEIAASVQETAARNLAGYAQPDSIHVVPSLPLNDHGKIDVAVLVNSTVDSTPAGGGTNGHAEEIPDRFLSTVLDAWRDLLSPAARVDTDFYGAGGHSLLAVRLSFALSTALGTDVRFIDILRFPTPRLLAEQLHRRVTSPTRGIRRLPRRGGHH